MAHLQSIFWWRPSHARSFQGSVVDFCDRLDTQRMFVGFDAADRLLANAGAGGHLGLHPASGLAAANDLALP